MSLWLAVILVWLISLASGTKHFVQGDCPQGLDKDGYWYPSKCKECKCNSGNVWACSDCSTKELDLRWSKCYVDKLATLKGTVLCPGDRNYKNKEPKKEKIKIKIKSKTKIHKRKKWKKKGKFW